MTREEEAIKWLKNLKKDIGHPRHGALWHYEQALDEIIQTLTQEPKTGEWISCSERLPDEKDCPMDCLVTRYSEQIDAYVDMAVCERDGTWTHEDWKAISYGDVESGRKTGLISTLDDEIIAWKPLPKPYREDGEK